MELSEQTSCLADSQASCIVCTRKSDPLDEGKTASQAYKRCDEELEEVIILERFCADSRRILVLGSLSHVHVIEHVSMESVWFSRSPDVKNTCDVVLTRLQSY